MTINEFKQSLKNESPPESLDALLEALWYDAQGDWKTAHQISQKETADHAAWVHGYLHLKEGDTSNAQYWYDQAGETMPDSDIQQEWERIAIALTKQI